MSFGSTAYASYVRIQTESGNRRFPSWSGLPHEKRLAWEAAAQAVARAVLPSSQYSDPLDDDEDGDGDELLCEPPSPCGEELGVEEPRVSPEACATA